MTVAATADEGPSECECDRGRTRMNDDSGKSTNPPWRVGQSFRCPACRSDSIVKKIREMDGWNFVRESLACAFCGAVLGSASSAADDGASAADAHGRAARRLAALLGDDDLESSRKWRAQAQAALAGNADGRSDAPFCRDCRHYIKHPFLSRCLLTDRAVEPMQDCARFERRPESNGEKRP